MKVKQTVTLPHDLLEWHKEEYSETTLSATLTLLLNQFRAIHIDVGLTPKRAARDAAKEVKELVASNIFSKEE